ncbi:YkgJ family cysteine cluster protein [Syntrophomonas wolfei]|uniref:Zinc/iron-chelating domain-containing protein n=1 Tax=Syntrophomonas wolfei TaxID=863 RepID=A0A354YYI6_9FIRM|nr:YkgJ family cysteine cluster protein [Syntrophomonas wolfei]HBK54274.1 zinc/iron-chelating domain-containing protein [Syntrophomonas wolfei]
MKKLELYSGTEQGRPAVGIRIGGEASIQDLLDLWQPLCDDSELFKSYAADNHAACRGCLHNCCQTAYVIPDFISFKKMAAHLHLTYKEFLSADFFDAEKLEAGIIRMKPNPCIFLRDNICSIYPWRSLICRFYICCQLMGDSEQLIYSICWSGSAATQLFAEQEGLINSNGSGALSSFDLMFKRLMDEYRFDPRVQLFLQADDYRDIPLSAFTAADI